MRANPIKTLAGILAVNKRPSADRPTRCHQSSYGLPLSNAVPWYRGTSAKLWPQVKATDTSYSRIESNGFEFSVSTDWCKSWTNNFLSGWFNGSWYFEEHLRESSNDVMKCIPQMQHECLHDFQPDDYGMNPWPQCFTLHLTLEETQVCQDIL